MPVPDAAAVEGGDELGRGRVSLLCAISYVLFLFLFDRESGEWRRGVEEYISEQSKRNHE